jgi:hypothetical protein
MASKKRASPVIFDEYGVWTEYGRKLAKEIDALLQPLIKKHVRRLGPRESRYLAPLLLQQANYQLVIVSGTARMKAQERKKKAKP